MHYEFPCLTILLGFIIGAVMIVPDNAQADDRDRYEARTYRDADGGALLYRLLKPRDYDAKKSYPLVLFFHGAGERGIDNKKQLIHGMGEFASDEIAKKYPCFVVAPQCPLGQQWVDTPWTAERHTMPEKPTPSLRQSIELIAALEKEFSIDSRRIYVTGLSMGGFGVWDAIQRHPHRFAAAVPVCGGGDHTLASRIAHIPIWAFHGQDDTVVKPKRARDMIAAIKSAKGSPRYTEYSKTGHNSWRPTYNDPLMYRWLFTQRKSAGK